MYETAAFHSGFSPKDNNDFVRRFYKTYSKALGVINLERQQIPVEGDVELDEKDKREPIDIVKEQWKGLMCGTGGLRNILSVEAA